MFCTNCGANNAPDTKFCTSCGAPLATETVQAPVATAAPKSGFDIGKVFSQLKDTVLEFYNGIIKPLFAKKAVLYGVIGGAALLVVAIILCIVLTPSKTGPIDTIIDIAMNENYDKIETLAPEAYWEYYEEYYQDNYDKNFDIDDYFDNIEETYEEQMEALNHRKNYDDVQKITYKVLKEKKVSEKKLDDIRDGLKERGINKKDITEAYDVKIEFTITGGDSGSETANIYLVKISGKWYAVYKASYGYYFCDTLGDFFDIKYYD